MMITAFHASPDHSLSRVDIRIKLFRFGIIPKETLGIIQRTDPLLAEAIGCSITAPAV
jgi:hypothetical protein